MPFDKIIALTSDIKYYNLRTKTVSEDIFLLFPHWNLSGERIAIISPRDIDAILGASYVMLASALNGAKIFIFIMCDGRTGYYEPELKKSIVEIRKAETIDAYEVFDIPSENIIMFNYPDFSLGARLEWIYPDGHEGVFMRFLKTIRNLQISRLIFPNGYGDSSDSLACYHIGRFLAPIAGEPILPELGEPVKIKTYILYSIFDDFSPDDFLLHPQSECRANVAIKVPLEIEQLTYEALRKFRSQSQIVEEIIGKRISRIGRDGAIEVYLSVDPHPALDYESYVRLISDIDSSSKIS